MNSSAKDELDVLIQWSVQKDESLLEASRVYAKGRPSKDTNIYLRNYLKIKKKPNGGDFFKCFLSRGRNMTLMLMAHFLCSEDEAIAMMLEGMVPIRHVAKSRRDYQALYNRLRRLRPDIIMHLSGKDDAPAFERKNPFRLTPDELEEIL